MKKQNIKAVSQRSIAALLVFSLTVLPGCSTMLVNADAQSSGPCSEPYIYGGAIFDAKLFTMGAVSLPEHPIGGLVMMTISAIDFPLSLSVDTLVLPMTVYKTLSQC